ncbi:MAG TPA: type II secretion system protein GspE [Nitrospirae bacterium]|nr:type II secretion system protein GspE [Nitrospirota bacterium]
MGATITRSVGGDDDSPAGGEGKSLKEMAGELGLEWIEFIEVEHLDLELISKASFQFAKANLILPLKIEDDNLVAATARPLDTQPLDDLRLLYCMPVKPVVAPEDVMIEAINRAYDLSADSAGEIIDDIQEEGDIDSLLHGLPEDLLETSAEAPVIRLVNSILVQAVKEKASDIHIEPYERELAVRYRIDGMLLNVVQPPKRLQSLIVSRVKIMAGLDIAEKRLPQDGRIRIVIAGNEVDIRVSVIPTSHGERVVMRLLDKAGMLLNLTSIGFNQDTLEVIEKLIHLPHGIILISGPTGSGKTTTLYAALSRINSADKNIITVEDPIEYQLSGIGQMPVNTKVGLTFATGLRSILRQDPDVIMVGEIRDLETAEIAVQASLTGHLVFSTIHTNDSAGAVTRLVEMGIEPFLISSSLVGVLAQRLVRVLCKDCRKPYEPNHEQLSGLGVDPSSIPSDTLFYKAQGCSKCRDSGYRGRTGIYELLVIDDDTRALIAKKADSTMIRKTAQKRGFTGMRENGFDTMIRGVTSLEEVARVTSDIA